MPAIIETHNLTKRYGALAAVNELSLQVDEGAIYGFVGPNGAGKTTTMRMLTTLLQPTSGQAFVSGCSITRDPRGVRRAIGYMPDFFGVYDDMKVWEYLDFFAACYEIPEATRAGLINDLLELVDLSHRRDDMVDTLSRGMKQRLCLARTLAHDPRVLILDEPASGLDPRARIEIRELLLELSRMGKTIFFSTHILADVAEICTQVGIIEAGRLVAQGSLADMQRRLRPHRRLHITLLGHLPEAHAALVARPGVMEVRQTVVNGEPRPDEAAEAVGQVGADGPASAKTLEVDFTGDDAAVSALLRELVGRGLPVLRFTESVHDLEDVFMHATQGIVS
ncbi:MAG: ABC transporter ATP-binding protein [Anaerolineales bacterium]|nr:ABC transporter ATP-binding protein [Anaerolineales bacterium]